MMISTKIRLAPTHPVRNASSKQGNSQNEHEYMRDPGSEKQGCAQHSVGAMHIDHLRHHDKRRKRRKILKEIKVRWLSSVGPRG